LPTLPFVSFAAVNTFKDFANVFVALIKGVVNILFVSLSVGLIYGVALYFIHSDNEDKREQIKGYLLWGVIGLTVAFGLWGIVDVLCGTFNWCVAGIPYISPPT
jgi:FtsH-binding integral membrane protein